jgi:hypothetical protein
MRHHLFKPYASVCSGLSFRMRGFNLIEVMLSLTFFAIAFSATMLGAQSLATANLNATQMQEENNAMLGIMNSIDFRNLDVEARYDVTATRQPLLLPNKQTIYYTLNVYSEPLFPDVKIADVALYRTPNAATAFRHMRKSVTLLAECHNYGAETPVQMGDLMCTPVRVSHPSTHNADLTARPNYTSVNNAYATATAYSAPGGSILTEQTGGAGSFNPELDNVWGGINSGFGPGATTANKFDFGATQYTNAAATSPLQRTGYAFNKDYFFATDNTNVRVMFPASSGALNTAGNNATPFRYDLEIGVVVPLATQKVRVYPLASNASDLTSGVGYLEYEAKSNNQDMTIRLQNLRPFHDTLSDRPHIGAALLYTNEDGTTLRVANPVLTYAIKRPHVGG